jgi:4a-hydroxytetrahydrobiopterin dehydratase
VSTLSKNNLATLHCKPLAAGTPPLQQEQITSLLQQLEGWIQQDKIISKTFTFKNFHQTMSFVNAVAWVSNQEDHHPDMNVSYSNCTVQFSTHSVGGLSENDFICAARVDALLTV